MVVSYWVGVYILTQFRDKADGMRNVFRGDREGVAGGLGPLRAWSKRDP